MVALLISHVCLIQLSSVDYLTLDVALRPILSSGTIGIETKTPSKYKPFRDLNKCLNFDDCDPLNIIDFS